MLYKRERVCSSTPQLKLEDKLNYPNIQATIASMFASALSRMTIMAALASAFYVRSAVAYEGDGAHTLDRSLSVVTTH